MAYSFGVKKTSTNLKLNLNNTKYNYKYNENYEQPIKKDENIFSKVKNFLSGEDSKDYVVKPIHYPEIDNDGFTAQGITTIDNKTFISAHGKKNARLYIYDNITGDYIGYINLDQKSHVGGTTCDKDNNILYVTNGGGKYSTYDYNVIKKIIDNKKNYENDILKYDLKSINNISKDEFSEQLFNSDDEEIKNLLKNKSIDEIYDNWCNNSKGKEYEKITNIIYDTHSEAIKNDINARCTASTTFFYDGLLYTCHFIGTKQGEMDILRPIYTTNEYGDKIITYEKATDELITIPPRTQGISVTDYNGKRYILFSQSIGRHNGSSITVYEVTDDGQYINKGVKYYEENGIEGITVDENGNVTACFEFENKTLTTDMDTLLNSLSSEANPSNWWQHGKQKIGGAYWDTGGAETFSRIKASWNTFISKPNVTNAVGSLFTFKGAIYEVVDIIIYAALPESAKTNRAYSNIVDTLGYGVEELAKDPLYTYADEINDNGLLSGLTRGSLYTISTKGAKKINFGFKGLMNLGQGAASLINSGAKLVGADIHLDLDFFDKASDFVGEKIDNFVDDTKEVVDRGIDKIEDGLDYAWDHTGGALCKKVKSILPFL